MWTSSCSKLNKTTEKRNCFNSIVQSITWPGTITVSEMTAARYECVLDCIKKRRVETLDNSCYSSSIVHAMQICVKGGRLLSDGDTIAFVLIINLFLVDW